jgi:ATP-dependent RNA helicase RhlE
MNDLITFDDLNINTPLHQALVDLNYVYPTTIQHRVFPIVMSGRDVCGVAQTGTGKTIAYLLPLLRLWRFNKEKDPQVVILVPTRELVTQVVDVIESLSKYLSLTVIGVYGGVNINTQKLAFADGVDFIVGTPGRFFDLANHGTFRVKSIKKLVIDEVDEMLNLGFRTQIKNIIEVLPEKRQNLFFSATITEDVDALMQANFNNPVLVEAAPTGTPLENIEQSIYELPNFNSKVNFLKVILQDKTTFHKVLIFTATKKLADLLFDEMQKFFPEEAGLIHSNKEQNHRFNTVLQFKAGTIRFIIATDIVARGIDVAEVSHVINMDVPDVPENYIHRIGRTGRADRKGISITLKTEKEQTELELIEALMNYSIPVGNIPENLVLSDILIPFEIEKPFMKSPILGIYKNENAGPSFHERSAKNSKTNFKETRKEKMLKKYGKPITKGKNKK